MKNKLVLGLVIALLLISAMACKHGGGSPAPSSDTPSVLVQ
jgi:hypothetical protein